MLTSTSFKYALLWICFIVHVARVPISLACGSNDMNVDTPISNDVKYIVIVDAGSTGSRGFVYRLTNDRNSEDGVDIEHLRVKGMKRPPGVSSFVSHVSDIGDYLAPLFERAASVIPLDHQATTEVYVLGTAGMRLVSEEDQMRVWDEVVRSMLADKRFPFHISRENVRTINGKEEAFYAALSTNYIAKKIDSDLMPIEGSQLVGALDMGGSSTQLVLHMGTPAGERVHETHFWSHSWLNYGVEKVRERVWNHFVHIGTAPHMKVNQEVDGGVIPEDSAADIHISVPDKSSHPPIIPNHCLFKNYTELYFDPSESKSEIFTMHGTGDVVKCKEALRKVLWPEGCVRSQHRPSCSLDDIPHPPIAGNTFYGMSVYYFALDCVRFLGVEDLTHWPIANVRELIAASESFCKMDWHDVNGTHDHSLNAKKGNHKKTSEEGLPFRCVESLYLSLLLEEGFGFDLDQRSLTLALKVEGVEVEWTLGYLLTKAVHHGTKPSTDAKSKGSNSPDNDKLGDDGSGVAEDVEVDAGKKETTEAATTDVDDTPDEVVKDAEMSTTASVSELNDADDVATAGALDGIKSRVRALKNSGLPASTLSKLFPDIDMKEFFSDEEIYQEAEGDRNLNKEGSYKSPPDRKEGHIASLRSRIRGWKAAIHQQVIYPVKATSSAIIRHSKRFYAPVAKSFQMFAQVVTIPYEFFRGRLRYLGKWLYRKLFELFHSRPL